jgi:predicted nucleic acid-binding protein
VKGTQELRGNIVLDTSVLVEYLLGSSSCGERIKEYFASLRQGERAHVSLYSISETYYILCRMEKEEIRTRTGNKKREEVGEKFANEKITALLESNAVSVHSTLELAYKTGEMKCERSLSIMDCAALALAEFLSFPAYFVREKELEREISKKAFDVNVSLLDCD